MVAKSEYTDVIKDFVVLLKNQTEGFSDDDLVGFLELLNTSMDESLPVVYLSDGKKLMFRYADGYVEDITTQKIKGILDYERFKVTGIVTPDEGDE